MTIQKQQKQGISLVELNLRLVQIFTKCNANSVTRPIWIEMFPLLILLAYVITPRYYIQISSGRSHKKNIFVRLENFGSICKDTDTGGVSHVSSHRTARDIKRRRMTWCNAWSNGDDRQQRADSKTDVYLLYWTMKCCSTRRGGKHGFCVSEVFVSFPKHWPCQSKSFKAKKTNTTWTRAIIIIIVHSHFNVFCFQEQWSYFSSKTMPGKGDLSNSLYGYYMHNFVKHILLRTANNIGTQKHKADSFFKSSHSKKKS